MDICLYELIYSEQSILPPPKIFTIPLETFCISRKCQKICLSQAFTIYVHPPTCVILQRKACFRTIPNLMTASRIYRVSVKSFPDYKHLLQENYVEYKHIFLNVPQLIKFFYNTLVQYNMCPFCISRSFLVINICNQGKTLCLPCRIL
jgi:hypothetical protein